MKFRNEFKIFLYKAKTTLPLHEICIQQTVDMADAGGRDRSENVSDQWIKHRFQFYVSLVKHLKTDFF